MVRWLRKPVAWMVAAECVVVAALMLLAWHVLSTPLSSDGAGPFSLPAASPTAGEALPSLPGGAPARPGETGPPPGLNVDPAFWRARLRILNRDTAALEGVEWRVAHAVMTAARSYLEAVVLPAIARAERRGG
jgi:hypothetical protein